MSYLGTTVYPIVTLPALVTDSLGYQPVDSNTVTQLNTTTGNYANSAYAAANTADQKAVTSGSYANAAFSTANTKTSNVGTVTSVGGTGTVNGITLTGTVTTSGNLTLGGTLDLSSPPTIGGVTANTGTFSNLSYTGTLTGGTGVVNLGSGQVYKDASGNVGIGTSTPNTSSSQGKLAIISSGVGIGVTTSTENGTGYHFATYNSNLATPALQYFVANDLSDVNLGNARGAVKFYANNTERMRIDTAGQVGIGFAPLATQGNLQVYKLISGGAPSTSGTTDANQTFAVNGSSVQLSFGAYANGTGWVQQRAGGNFAVNYDLNLQPNGGNVGIGTTSPAARLSSNVSGAGSVTALNLTNSNGGFAAGTGPAINFGLADSTTLGAFGKLEVLNETATIGSNAYMAFSTRNADVLAEKMRISAAGNVGIGTSAPASKLEVTGDITQTWAASMDRFVGSKFSTTYELGLHFIESSRETRIVSKTADSTGFISFYTGVTPTERMRINTDGRLLFRTTTLPASSWNTNSLVNIQAGVQLTHTGNAAIWRQLSWSGDTADTALFFPNQAGNVASLSAAGAWTNASDGRLKTNVTDITHGLVSVMAAQPRSYTRIDCSGNYIGFVAQELKEVIPEVVLGSEETQYGVDYGSLVAVAFKAIQELKAEFDAYKLSHP